MHKRISAIFLAVCLLLTTPALAAQDSQDNFVRSRTYSGQFSDLTTDSVFYENVAALYEYGLSVGKGDGTFGLQDTMSVGQIVIFAARIRSLYRTGDPEAGAAAYSSENAYTAQPYLRYLQSEGVLGTELDSACAAGTPATRAQVAHVLAGTLPTEALPLINDSVVTQCYASRRYITDVTEYTPYFRDILTLYRTGVSMGSDETGSYQPDALITRGAAAAMLTRMVDPELRITLDWSTEPDWSAEGRTMASLVEPGTYIAAPTTTEEMDESVRYMLSSGENVLTLQYSGGLTAASARSVMEASLSVVKSYCEQCYNTVSCTYTPAGTITLTFSAASTGGDIESYRTETMAAAISVHDQLWSQGAITADMSEWEKARVYYTWICENTTYDYSADESSLSHIAYRLFMDGTAVCDGYTGAYNLLLKLEGIDCTTLSNDEHIWTVATLDGTQVHIDTTWGDSGAFINYSYFAMTPTQSWNIHSW